MFEGCREDIKEKRQNLDGISGECSLLSSEVHEDVAESQEWTWYPSRTSGAFWSPDKVWELYIVLEELHRTKSISKMYNFLLELCAINIFKIYYLSLSLYSSENYNIMGKSKN